MSEPAYSLEAWRALKQRQQIPPQSQPEAPQIPGEIAAEQAPPANIFDGKRYTPEEYPKKVGWGHATTSYATDLAVLGQVKRAALFHHDPTHSDSVVDDIVNKSRSRAAAYGSGVQVIGAAEGDTIEL